MVPPGALAFVASSLWHWLHRLGAPGLLLLGLVDNSPVPLPGSMDVLTIWLAAREPRLWPLYAVLATIGSLIGGYVTYALARKGGKPALEKRVSKRTASRVYRYVEHWGFFAVVLPALLPPPVPIVREAVGQLPSGRPVLGIGDTVAVNDPLTAPGANSAAKAADAYLAAIRAHGDAPYDRAFMERTSDAFWNSTMRFVCEWNNTLLRGMPEHILRALVAANEDPAIRDRFVNGFANPADYFGWLVSPDQSTGSLDQMAA